MTQTWTVAELSEHLARLMAGAFPDDAWVEGQIRNLTRAANGHVYFDLAEPVPMGEAPKAQLAVTLLEPERMLVNQQLRRAGGTIRMADGVEVRIQGRIRWYGRRGALQVRMHGIDPAFTLGRLQADREQLLARLSAEGLLDRNGRLPLPRLPLRLGLVTSRGSAAHADVLAELDASGIGFHVVAVDARTQGPECEPSVVRALAHLASHGVDLVLVVRGGGARTDLAGFDTEAIARAIATSPVPVFTGIGHEIDRSVADEVAHTAHKTPTAAAAAVVELVQGFARTVDRHAATAQRAVHRSLAVAGSRLDDRADRLGRSAARALDRAGAELARHQGAIGGRAVAALVRAEGRLATLDARAQVHDPQAALRRGWSITTTEDGRLVRSTADAPAGTTLVTRVADGHVLSIAQPPALTLPEEPDA
ncbi:MAG: exodeoxyribonuclease VII large subunit [Acidimicrobiales bacterium]